MNHHPDHQRPMISLHDCAGIRSALPRFLDGESGPVEETQISRHLESCHDCRQQYDQWRDEWLLTIETLNGVQPEEVQQLARATTQKIAQEIASQKSASDRQFGSTGRWWSAAAALLLGVLLFPGLLPPTADPLENSLASSFTLIRGDVDANGQLDWADFQSLVGWLQEDGPQPRCLAAGDLNEDGHVTIEDSVLALARLASGTGLEMTLLYPQGAIDSLPCKDLCP
ncbi:MAG: zf-HC2 domain-containing protein [Planctomycetota bacterium]